MATKPRSEWSAAYRRRIERGEARGFSKQRARGHGTPRSISGISEYRVRTERAIAAGRLTPSERAWLARRAIATSRVISRAHFQAFQDHYTARQRDQIRELQASRHAAWRAAGSPWSTEEIDYGDEAEWEEFFDDLEDDNLDFAIWYHDMA